MLSHAHIRIARRTAGLVRRLLRPLAAVLAMLAILATAGSSPAPAEAARPTVRLLFVGASITDGWFASDPSQAFPELVAGDLQGAGYDPDLAILAHPGATAGRAGGWDLARPADAIVVHLVTNDFVHGTPLPVFQLAYGRVLRRLRAASPRARLVCLGGWTAPGAVDRAGIGVTQYDQVAAAACAAVNGRYVDITGLFAVRADRGPIHTPSANGPRDNVHPNDLGHRRLARAVLDALAMPRPSPTPRTGRERPAPANDA